MRLPTAFLLLLCACSPPRPEGTFTPRDLDDDIDEDAYEGEPDDEPLADGGRQPDPILDAGALDAHVDPNDPLSSLAGSYLMRVDYYSRVSNAKDGYTFELKTRVGNLFVTTLERVEGGLRAREQLCFQSYEHECVRGCTRWKTETNTALPALFQQQVVERTYAVDAQGNLSAEPALLRLGYDGEQGEPPTSPDDARVWSVASGRKGVATRISADLSDVPVFNNPSITCYVDGTQTFTTRIGPVSGAALLLAGTPHPVSEQPVFTDFPISASGVSATFCTNDNLRTTQANDTQAFVRFQRVGNMTGCPSSLTAYVNAFGVSIDPPTR